MERIITIACLVLSAAGLAYLKTNQLEKMEADRLAAAEADSIAAAEAAIGLAIIVVYYRNSGTIRVEEIDKLKG